MFRWATHSATDQRAGSARRLHRSSGITRTSSCRRACALRYSSATSWSCGCMSLRHLLCRPLPPFAAPPLVHPSLQASQSPYRGSIARHFLQCAPVLRHRVQHLAFLLVDPRQVHVRELRRLVARRVHRLFEPRNRVVLPPQLDEIAPEVDHPHAKLIQTSPPSPSRQLISLPLLLMLAAVALGWNLNGYRLFDPDEGRNAEVAREMAQSNDYVVPHLDGLPYLDK